MLQIQCKRLPIDFKDDSSVATSETQLSKPRLQETKLWWDIKVAHHHLYSKAYKSVFNHFEPFLYELSYHGIEEQSSQQDQFKKDPGRSGYGLQ